MNVSEYFKGDFDVVKYCNPSCMATTAEEVGELVSLELSKIADQRSTKIFYNEWGYFFYISEGFLWWKKKILISFCVKKEFRTVGNLCYFWKNIQKRLGSKFLCYMNTRNKRAIDWLLKCGMHIHSSNKLITVLYI